MDKGSPLRACFLGRVDYQRAWNLQERLRDRIVAASPVERSSLETVLLVEHEPVVTLGRSTRAEHLHGMPDSARRLESIVTSRGGSVTYHGPGQIVVYPVMHIGMRVRVHVERLCRSAVTALRDVGLDALYREEHPGVWIGNRKIAAVGVHVRRGVSIHGLALNVTTDLSGFTSFVPCGLAWAVPTSIAAELGAQCAAGLRLEDLGFAVARELARRCGRDLVGIAGADVGPYGDEGPANGLDLPGFGRHVEG